MNGAVWAAASGVDFGVFQSLNRRAVARMDVQLATFLQLCIAAAVLVAVSLAAADLGRLLSPVVMGRHVERVTRWVWAGAGLVVGGSLVPVARTL